MDIKVLLFLFVLVALFEVNQVNAVGKKSRDIVFPNGTIITTERYDKNNGTNKNPAKTVATRAPLTVFTQNQDKTTVAQGVTENSNQNNTTTTTLAPHQNTTNTTLAPHQDHNNQGNDTKHQKSKEIQDVVYAEDPERDIDEVDEEKELAKDIIEIQWDHINNNNKPTPPQPPKTICERGRTRIKMGNPKLSIFQNGHYNGKSRRFHMNAPAAEDETCEICICNTFGSEEKCMKRPARNVNECIRLAKIKDYLARHPYFSHEQTLAGRIRRDYLWHRDEIPYLSNAVCYRGASYYTNSRSPLNQTIDISSDVESILDYRHKSICYFCVCNLGGTETTCIKRDRWFCDYLRYLRGDNYDPQTRQREMHMDLFNEDRPAYFRSLSYRLRRTMDDGINGLLDLSGGDTLCCDHPNGHRRSLQRKVRDKLVQLRKKVTKENLLGQAGGDYEDFVVNND